MSPQCLTIASPTALSHSITLGPSDCHIWWADPTTIAGPGFHLLNTREQARFATYRKPADRDRFVAGRALLRTAVAGYLDTPPELVRVAFNCPDCAAPHGRPTLPGSGLEVSLSHSGSQVAVAITRIGPVGIDVEEIDPGLQVAPLLPHVLSNLERERGLCPTVQGFYRTWTRKEAVLKATGQGLRVPLRSIGVSDPDDVPQVLFFGGNAPGAEDFVLADLEAGPGYAASIAVIGRSPIRFTAFSEPPQ